MKRIVALALVACLVLPAIAAAQQCQCRPCCGCADRAKLNFGVEMSKLGSRDVRLDKLPEIEGQVSAVALGLRHIREDLEAYHYVQLAALAGLGLVQFVCLVALRAKS